MAFDRITAERAPVLAGTQDFTIAKEIEFHAGRKTEEGNW